MADFPLLTALIVTPLAAAAIVALLPKGRRELVMPVGIGLSMLPVALAGYLFVEFERVAEFQFVERLAWFEPWDVSWHLGVDGISMPLVVLSTLLIPISLLASTTQITDRVKEFVVMVLILEAGLIGVFLSLDLLIFFIFFEVILVPMYFIIGIWGSEDRIYAAMKFFIYTMVGSALMLAAIISMSVLSFQQTGSPTFDYLALLDLEIGRTQELWLFAGFALAFAIKVPLFPVHTWLPDAHVQAPTAGSVLLAGVLLKLGTYGLLRFNLGLFPEATVEAVPVLAVLAVIGIIYGAVVAIVQPDLKKLVAYSSVSHLGFIVLGIVALTQAGLQGSVVQMVNHGLTTGALFLLVGMIYERRHTKKIADFGGLQKVMPIFAGLFLFSAFASIGLPGLNGFVGEFLVLIGSYPTLPAYAIIAAVGVILAAVYLLWAYERVFTGEPDKEENRILKDLDAREIGVMVPIVVLIIVLGLFPNVLLERIEPSTDALLERVELIAGYDAPELTISLGGFFGD